MTDAEIISERKFSDAEMEVLECFLEFHRALIDKNKDKLDEIILDTYELVHMSGKRQTKEEFISEVMDGTLNYFKSEIQNPSVLFDDEDSATVIADVRLTARVYGSEGVWTLNSLCDFRKIDGKWYFGKWDN